MDVGAQVMVICGRQWICCWGMERMEGRVGVGCVGGHEDKSKHQRGDAKAGANCTAVKRGMRGKVRLLLPGVGG